MLITGIIFIIIFKCLIVKDWVKQLTRLRGYTDQMVEDANAVIFTFGSYRLGVSILSIIFSHMVS